MPNKIVPDNPENFRFGMNDIDNIKKVEPGVLNYLHNAYPDISLKPMNGVNDVVSTTVEIDGYPAFFTPQSIYVTAGDKEWVFILGRYQTDGVVEDGNILQIWNITDKTRHQLLIMFSYEFDTAANTVFFSFTKRYNSVYLTMSQRIDYQYDPVTSVDDWLYKIKNKIFDYNTTSGLWVERSMGIDKVPKLDTLPPALLTQANYANTSFYATAVHLGSMYKTGGYGGGITYDDITDKNVYKCSDGVNWRNDSVLSKYVVGGRLVSFKNVLYHLPGRAGNVSYSRTIRHKDERYGDWDVQGTAPWSNREGFSAVVFKDAVYVVGGRLTDGTPANDIYYNTVYSSANMSSWSLLTAAAIPGTSGVAYCGLVVDQLKMYLICGIRYDGANATVSNTVYSTTDGITWVLAGTAGAIGRHNPGVAYHAGILWMFGGQDWAGGIWTGTAHNDLYYSLDSGANWTLYTSAAYPVVDNITTPELLYYKDGLKAINSDNMLSDNGTVTWDKVVGGLDSGKYYSYAFTYVRRTDIYSTLQNDVNFNDIPEKYDMKDWEYLEGVDRCPTDEFMLTGTITISGNDLAGTDTLFSTELAVGDYIRVNGAHAYFKILTISSNTVATMSNSDSITGTDIKFSKIPSIGDPITNQEYTPGIIEGVEDLENRIVVYTEPSYDANTIVFKFNKSDYDSDYGDYLNQGVRQGATHIRIYRTLGHSDEETAKGLPHRFLVDIALGDDVDLNYGVSYYYDKTTDAYLSGITDFLEMTGYSPPPLARYSVWANNMLWVSGVTIYSIIDVESGNDDEYTHQNGYVYHSVDLKAGLVSVDIRYPDKYACMFDLLHDFKTCNPDDGQKDTGLAVLEGDLYIFKENSIYVIYNADPTNNPVDVSNSIGCVCPHTITNADIPALGGKIIFFLSGEGPAYIQPGGKVNLFIDFKIEYLQKNQGILKRNATGSTTAPTDWYSRNKVSATFWNNALWVLFGDFADNDSQINEGASTNGYNRICGFYFSPDQQSNGPFIRDFTTIKAKYEPQVLIPVDNSRAYTLSHIDEYKLTQFNDPTKYIDTLIVAATPTDYSNNLKIITRAFQSDVSELIERALKSLNIYMDFNDTETFTIKIYTNVNGQIATCSFSQVRNSGLLSYSDFQYRDFISILSQHDLRHAFYHHVEITKQVPSDGNVELHGVKLVLGEPVKRQSKEHMNTFGSANNVGFVVEAGTDPEVDAHA